MAVAPSRLGTVIGIADSPPEVPLPSSPLRLLPQQETVPSDSRAQRCVFKYQSAPIETAVTFVRPSTGAGASLPGTPVYPQQVTPLSDTIAHAALPPATI